MRNREGCRRGGEAGVVAAEFALVSAVLFTVLFGVIEFGLMMNLRILVTTAARESARRAAVDGGASAAAESRAFECLQSGMFDPSSVEVEIRPREASYGSTIVVRVACAYEPLTPVIRAVTGGPVRLEAEVATRSEKVR